MGLDILDPRGSSICGLGRSVERVPRQAQIQLEEFQRGLKELPGSILLVITMLQEAGEARDGLCVVEVRYIKALETAGAIHDSIRNISIDPGA